MKWRRLRLVFDKRKLRSISAVEYMVNGLIIRTTNQIEMKEAVMRENTSRFSLVYSLPVFNPTIIEKLEQWGQMKEIEDLVYSNIALETLNGEINSFLALMHQPNQFTVLTKLKINRQNNHRQKSKEKTVSSFSGLYFEYYKV